MVVVEVGGAFSFDPMEIAFKWFFSFAFINSRKSDADHGHFFFFFFFSFI